MAKKNKAEYISVDTRILDKTRRQLDDAKVQIDFLMMLATKLLVISMSDSISDEDYKTALKILEKPQDYDDASQMAAFAVGLRGAAKQILGEDVSFMEFLQYTKKATTSIQDKGKGR
jgi:hypothetical protein